MAVVIASSGPMSASNAPRNPADLNLCLIFESLRSTVQFPVVPGFGKGISLAPEGGTKVNVSSVTSGSVSHLLM